MQSFIRGLADATSKIVDAKAAGYDIIGNPRNVGHRSMSPRHEITGGTYPALAKLIDSIVDRAGEAPTDRSRASQPSVAGNTRNDMYLTSEAVQGTCSRRRRTSSNAG